MELDASLGVCSRFRIIRDNTGRFLSACPSPCLSSPLSAFIRNCPQGSWFGSGVATKQRRVSLLGRQWNPSSLIRSPSDRLGRAMSLPFIPPHFLFIKDEQFFNPLYAFHVLHSVCKSKAMRNEWEMNEKWIFRGFHQEKIKFICIQIRTNLRLLNLTNNALNHFFITAPSLTFPRLFLSSFCCCFSPSLTLVVLFTSSSSSSSSSSS